MAGALSQPVQVRGKQRGPKRLSRNSSYPMTSASYADAGFEELPGPGTLWLPHVVAEFSWPDSPDGMDSYRPHRGFEST